MHVDKPPSVSLERLHGTLERVTFHSEENGFCVLRVRVKGHRDLITVTGNAASITAGEFLECAGVWVNNKTYGLQFQAQQLNIVAPTTLEGVEKYLGSGMVKGIGPHFAKKLVNIFGVDVFDIIEKEPERLTALPGIGDKRKQGIVAAWKEQKVVRDIMVFLQSHGVGTARAVRIYKTYGDAAIEQVRNDPYRLALDIRGIGFKTADELANSLGVAKDSMLRAQAGVRHVLQELCDHGHCAARYEQLVNASVALLAISEDIIKDAIAREIQEKNLIPEQINGAACVFPASLYRAESGAAKHLLRLRSGSIPWGNVELDEVIPWVEGQTGLKLSPSQAEALATVLQNKLSIITGGPGVGKTTLVNSVLKIVRAEGLAVALAAPTGRAAKRLSETTGQTAKTIHRLLVFDPKNFGFKHNQDNPLPIDVLVVDEVSMLDVVLLYHLLKALPQHVALIFVGDVDQLPSVGSGAVLADLLRSSVIASVRLTEIFRQVANSRIIVNAHRINNGQMPLMNVANEESDFYTLYVDSSEEILDKLLHLVTTRIPKRFNCHPITDIQVLTPMHRGGLGSRSLNVALQKLLNGEAAPKIMRYGTTFAPGDKVIQNVNNYDKDVFNGDIGSITQINSEQSTLKIVFDNRIVEYDFNEMDELSLAYAISIHKSQGSEFPIIVMPLSTQHYMLLARNLLYTGLTRGKKLVILVAQKRAVGIAVNNNKEANRLTKLAERLVSGVQGGGD